jgi:hypothetical protein
MPGKRREQIGAGGVRHGDGRVGADECAHALVGKKVQQGGQ